MKNLSSLPAHVCSALEVDLQAIEHNYKKLCERFTGEKVAAIVKDDAYSMGLEGVAPALFKAGCRDFFVATVEDASTVKAHVPESNIYVLNGVYEGAEDPIYAQGLIPVLISFAQLEKWSAKAQSVGEKLKAIVHFDTGMSRSGLSDECTSKLLSDMSILEPLDIRYWMSHLACSDQPEHPLNKLQLSRFQELVRKLPTAKTSFVNSDGIFLGPDYHGDMARPGLSLYGFNAASKDLKPAVSVHSKILQIRKVSAGSSIGYGATHTFDKPSRVATVPVGYAQGWSTSLSNQAHVAINGIKAPIIGRVSMDLMGIDITHLPENEVQENQWVELIGPTISPKELAKAGRTIAYEIILTLRNHYRIYKTN